VFWISWRGPLRRGVWWGRVRLGALVSHLLPRTSSLSSRSIQKCMEIAGRTAETALDMGMTVALQFYRSSHKIQLTFQSSLTISF
jgi:hypothetical protein